MDELNTKIQELAKEASRYFTTRLFNEGQIDEKTITINTEGTPEWVKNLVRESHAGHLPDDYKYTFIANALDLIVESGDFEDVEDVRSEIQADTSTHDLLVWLDSHSNRTAYTDVVLEEYWPQDTHQLLELGQLREREEVFDLVVSELTKRAEHDLEA